jgi:hypothetical protein
MGAKVQGLMGVSFFLSSQNIPHNLSEAIMAIGGSTVWIRDV